ncbi:ketopantoate reductase PanE/ApbA C terminal-domain-containing protein [Penicillium capsulatum]|uniref:2-dehydropantoate 2-reductase n=1 Tax=Penicillium capsulatum TaxID=69766 RepID=A0A9W9HZE5_9EURO|nr:ketopantoate reductase PanE/ApbA C terminal-domain-containing protein [Penicillium capsulatum]KAJ6117043.1 ketopantoate reductase PanE/ApbA C terminal-domain-containing protein [Penicillium capsulatum]
MAKSRVLVVGTGGIGTMSAYALEKGGLAEVTAVMRSNYDAAVKNGIDIDSVLWGQIKAWRPSAITKTVPDVSKGDVAPFDFILVTTKNIPDVPPTVADIIAPAVTPGKTAIVLSQNGINIEKPLITRFPTNPLISSVAYTGATETALAKIYNDDPDCQKIGAFTSPQVPTNVAEEATKRYVNIYNPDGKLNIIYEPDVAKVRWRKIAYNGSMNPVASILRMDTPRMRMSRHVIDDLILPVIGEIRAIAEASGITLQPDLVHAVLHQDPNDTAFKPSMCQDYEKGNLMEIENLVGEPLREAEKLHVPTPTLKIIYGIMKGLQLKVKEEKGLWEPGFQSGNPYE